MGRLQSKVSGSQGSRRNGQASWARASVPGSSQSCDKDDHDDGDFGGDDDDDDDNDGDDGDGGDGGGDGGDGDADYDDGGGVRHAISSH